MYARTYFRQLVTLRIIFLILYLALGIYSPLSNASRYKSGKKQWIEYQSALDHPIKRIDADHHKINSRGFTDYD
jgi:hypothetical protein